MELEVTADLVCYRQPLSDMFLLFLVSQAALTLNGPGAVFKRQGALYAHI